MIVRESINFKRGIDSKTGIDVGIKRSENYGPYIQDSLKRLLIEFDLEYRKRFETKIYHPNPTVIANTEVKMTVRGEPIEMVIQIYINPSINGDYSSKLKKRIRDWLGENFPMLEIIEFQTTYDYFDAMEKWNLYIAKNVIR